MSRPQIFVQASTVRRWCVGWRSPTDRKKRPLGIPTVHTLRYYKRIGDRSADMAWVARDTPTR